VAKGKRQTDKQWSTKYCTNWAPRNQLNHGQLSYC